LRAPVLLAVVFIALGGCAARSAFMPLDDWITQTLIDVDSGVRGQTKFVYAGPGKDGSVSLTVTGVGSGGLDVGSPAGFYVLVSGKVGATDTRTVALKLDPVPDVAQARVTTARRATIYDCESGGFLDHIFGDGKIHVLGMRQVPFGR
jgi:hypothetical protein